MRRPAFVARGLPAALLCLGFVAPAAAERLDTRLIANGFEAPLFATAPLADGRVFVVEQGGAIKIAERGRVSTFMRIDVPTAGEQGLLGLAFDPGYGDAASAGYRRFFVNYIDPATKDTVIASYRAQADGKTADLATRTEVMRVAQPPGRDNHKAGWIGFKPGDATHLYIATGDGGAANDPDNNAQNPAVLLGKMLRIDVNRDDFADPNINYGVPQDNPFVGTAGARGEIFALGLRNPFRNSFDRETGDLWIADVGQNFREEIDFIGAASPGGQNFGWRIREGDIATPGVGGPDPGGLTAPVMVYDHSFGAAVTGGYVVREAGSILDGQYVFGDFISGRVWSIAADGSAQTLADAREWTPVLNAGRLGPLGNISSFGEGASGELYVVSYGGTVARIATVVPEPSSLALMLLGGAGVAAAVRRRRRPGEVERPAAFLAP